MAITGNLSPDTLVIPDSTSVQIHQEKDKNHKSSALDLVKEFIAVEQYKHLETPINTSMLTGALTHSGIREEDE